MMRVHLSTNGAYVPLQECTARKNRLWITDVSMGYPACTYDELETSFRRNVGRTL